MQSLRSQTLGAQAAGGAAWTVTFSILTKVVAFFSQIALSWYLLPEGLGLAAMAFSVSGMCSILAGNHVQKVLIQRQKEFSDLAGQAFWLALFLNTLAAIMLMAVAPLAAGALKQKEIIGLSAVIALSMPLAGLNVVTSASLYVSLRFKTIAGIQFIEGLIRNLGAVALAAAGWGAYSLVIPVVASSAFATVACKMVTGHVSLPRPAPASWKPMFASSCWLMLNAACIAAQGYGVNFLIGCLQGNRAAGLFFWANALASQSIYLVATNLQTVLFPIFSQMRGEEERQTAAFLRTAQTTTLIVTPICALQALLAEPIIRLVFHERWVPASSFVQWLSIGMVAQPVANLGLALLLSKGKNRYCTLLMGVAASVLLLGTVIGAAGTMRQMAIALGVSLLSSNLAIVALSLPGHTRTRMFQILLPLLPCGVAVAAGWAVTAHLGSTATVIRVVLEAVVVLTVYVALCSWILRSTVRDTLTRARLLLPQKFQKWLNNIVAAV